MIKVGNAVVSLERREVRLDGQYVNLGGRAFDILAILIRAKGHVVSKCDLIRQVWADTIVEDNNLQVHISCIRKLLGDPALIQTIPRRGYRLRLPAEPSPFDPVAPECSEKPSVPPTQQVDTAPTSSGMVYVVDDDEYVRTALSRLLRAHGINHISFSSAEEFLEAKLGAGTACLLLDVSLPAATGLDLQAELARTNRPWPIVFMTGYGSISMTVQAMKAGAVEFLTKPFDEQILISTLRQVLKTAELQRLRWEESEAARTWHASLTAREREVFTLLITGITNKEIARRLGTSEVTTKVHKRRVLEKMRAQTVVELVERSTMLNGYRTM